MKQAARWQQGLQVRRPGTRLVTAARGVRAGHQDDERTRLLLSTGGGVPTFVPTAGLGAGHDVGRWPAPWPPEVVTTATHEVVQAHQRVQLEIPWLRWALIAGISNA